MSTIIYLIRHGKTDKTKLVEASTELIGHKEIDLDESFIPKIKELSKKLELYKIQNVYSSNYIRTKRTASILSNNKEIKIDDRLGERKGGNPTMDITPEEYYKMQFDDPDFKFPEGESVNEIIVRMYSALKDILEENRNGQAIVVSHGAAITFLLRKWCDIQIIDVSKKIRRFKFKGKVIHEGVVSFIQCFKLTFNEAGDLDEIEVQGR